MASWTILKQTTNIISEAQLFTLLMSDVCQEINGAFEFIKSNYQFLVNLVYKFLMCKNDKLMSKLFQSIKCIIIFDQSTMNSSCKNYRCIAV